jgi:hypothetical protein
MLVLGCLLTIIYLIYFRPDGGNISSALKILKGLNSNTFNYLESNSGTLMVEKDVPLWKKGQTITTISFFSTCVRLNKPCVIQGLASDWPATKNWGDDLEKDNKLLEVIGGDTNVTVHQQSEFYTQKYALSQEGFSFSDQSRTEMPYSAFLSKITDEAYYGLVSLKEDRRDSPIQEKIMSQIMMPEFYHEVAELEDIELIQGAKFIGKPHYQRKEQIMCAIDGKLDVILVPHVNRQEVYAGKMID